MRHIKTVSSSKSFENEKENFSTKISELKGGTFPVPLGYEARNLYIFPKGDSEPEATWLRLEKKTQERGMARR